MNDFGASGNIPDEFKKALEKLDGMPDKLKKASAKVKANPVNFDVLDDRIKEELIKPCSKPATLKEMGTGMGIGMLGDANTVFARKFRWTLEGDGLDSQFIKKVKLNLTDKTIRVQIYEVATKENIDSLKWLDSLDSGNPSTSKNDRTLHLTTYDGCGKEIYRYTLSDLHLQERKVSFDYSDSKASVTKATVKFHKWDREHLYSKTEKKTKAVYKKHFKWGAKLLDPNHGSKEVMVKLDVRPQLNIEEIPIDHLNAKTWIPGKAEWEKLNIKLDKTARHEFLKDLMNGNYRNMALYLYDGTFKLLETWVLENVRVSNIIDIDEEFCTLQIRYNGVSYNSPRSSE